MLLRVTSVMGIPRLSEGFAFRGISQKLTSDCSRPEAINSGRRHFSGLSSARKAKDSLPVSKEDEKTQRGQYLIHWKGEDVEGYSIQFRHLEFQHALSAVLMDQEKSTNVTIDFRNALSYNGEDELPDVKLEAFNEAMQYLDIKAGVSLLDVNTAAMRCSLIHAVYKVAAIAPAYDDLARAAVANDSFRDMYTGERNANDTWCFRVRNYDTIRHSTRARSMKWERQGLKALEPLLIRLGGKVQLDKPDCKIYVFDGLDGGKNHKVLARRLVEGPKTSALAPKRRMCVTNTPLCPIAVFIMCNLAGIRGTQKVLDPFAGSCTTLLASTMIAPHCQTVGIEIAHNGLVNRHDVLRDFESRKLKTPVKLIHGDCNTVEIRSEARNAIGNQPFDAIITDPPYGIRESKNTQQQPLAQLMESMAHDLERGRPLLKKGGRMVAFVPTMDGDNVHASMPSTELAERAALKLNMLQEQPLNGKLSRWMVAYTCTRDKVER